MVGAENRNHVRLGLLYQVYILINGVGGAAVPILALRAHLRGNRNDEVITQQAGGFPTLAQVLQQRLALELNQDVDGIDP